MPEGPEIHMASKFINRVCANRLFTGKPLKSEVNKNIDITWNSKAYSILSKSRGKELMLTLTDVNTKRSQTEPVDILFHFGMSGVFKFTPVNQLPKHAHLKFHTLEENPPMVLSFVDVRRFGNWKISSEWSPDRGPDPVFEYEQFRENVLNNLNDTTFNKSICEVLLNQSYFNGTGNYLRAEILFRTKTEPFQSARSVLEPLCTEVKQEGPDLLQLCQSVPLEVINLGGTNIYGPDATEEELKSFVNWLQCYNKTSMKKMQDHNKRTIWFHGQPGPLAPKQNESSRKPKQKKAVKKEHLKMEDPTLENVGDDASNRNSKAKPKRKVIQEANDPSCAEENDEISNSTCSSKTKIKRKVKKEDIPLTRSRTKLMMLPK